MQSSTGKDATQAEFYKIISELLERDKQVIIASTKSPQDMTILIERFTSMFELGGVFEIKRPDLYTRLEILRRRGAEGNLELSDEELNKIADSAIDNVRELLNAFNSVVRNNTSIPLILQNLWDKYLNKRVPNILWGKMQSSLCPLYSGE